MPHTIDIVGNEMVVLDEDGNGCDCCRLVGLRAAKRQLRRWQEGRRYLRIANVERQSDELTELEEPLYDYARSENLVG